MKLSELADRLVPFCADRYEQPVRVFDVTTMPGHAGFAYGFRVAAEQRIDAWFIRLPPPNVNWVGTADVLRQVEALNALDRCRADARVPHCSVRWSGDDLSWFGCPYFVVPWLQGDVVRLGPVDTGAQLDDQQLLNIGEQAMTALANLHKVDIAEVPYLGAPVPFDEDVKRWDRFYERAADPQALDGIPDARRKLLDSVPQNAVAGLFHGDFQSGNLFLSPDHELTAVIDWELTGVGATLNDVGWICTFSDREAWAHGPDRAMFLDPQTLIGFYERARGRPLRDLNWYRALAAYKFAIITGFNLSLHRRGKRVDPTWEQTALSMRPLVNRALELLG